MNKTIGGKKLGMNTQKKRTVTKKQLAILQALYRFRFGTADLLAQTMGLTDGRYIHARLQLLMQNGSIGRQYSQAHRLGGKPATYYLLPPAFAALKQYETSAHPLSHATLKNAYKDKSASDRFIAHKLAVFSIHNTLKQLYGEPLRLWTKDEIDFNVYTYFPARRPDAYIRLSRSKNRLHDKQFLLLYLDDATPLFVHTRRAQHYVEYFENDAWELRTETKIQSLLIVCESPQLLKLIRKKLAWLIKDHDETCAIAYTTLNALLATSAEDDEVWQDIRKPLELFNLEEL